eukprot:gene4234-4653_t
MGSGASLSALSTSPNGGSNNPIVEVVLKQLPEAVEESIYIHERFPLVIDPSEQAARFFKYQTGAYINSEDLLHFTKVSLNRALVASLLNGRTLTLRFPTLEGLTEDTLFEEGLFPKEVLNRNEFFQDHVWRSVLKVEKGDPLPEEASISSEFAFIICTASDYIPDKLRETMHLIKVKDSQVNGEKREGGEGDAVAELYGAQEIIRNSIELVEAAFDGDLDEVQNQIAKGFHLESVDGRKHTALSEAASQGHLNVVNYLLEHGADPNALSDTGRSPLWRAAFNNHVEVVQVLLEAGASPEHRDKTSLESAFDVAQSEEMRALLSGWDLNKTEKLLEERKKVILANLEARIKSSAEREFVARNLLRKELVEKAENGDVEGIKELLTMVAEEASKSNSKPRATAEVRNDLGQSLLSIAAQRDDVVLAEFLLTYWKELDKDRWDLVEGEVSSEAKVFKGNPNSRDLKGWTCVCIAVFHDAKKVLQLLLDHGGDPNIRSSYNKNAWDLAKDELDAAEKVVKSHAEIRSILEEFDRKQNANPRLFSNGEVVKGSAASDLYDGLDKDGTAVVMNIEMNQEQHANRDVPTPKKKGNAGGKPKAGGGSSGSGAKAKKK